MKTSTHTTMAEGVGRMLGRVWAAYKRQAARVARWMVGKGLSTGGARMTLWAAKLLVLGILLYVAFWLALLVVFTFLAAWLARNADDSENEDKPQWRNGWSGYGLYRGDVRIDPGASDDDE